MEENVLEILHATTRNQAMIFFWLSAHADDEGLVTASRREIAAGALRQPDRKHTGQIVADLYVLADLGLIEKNVQGSQRRNQYKVLVPLTKAGVREWLK